MSITQIPFENIRFFSTLIKDYISKKDSLESLYRRFPSIEQFEKQIIEKQSCFTDVKRNILSLALQEQYADCQTSYAVKNNIQLLKKSNTFTVTTGHQLSLFTGPLYFVYKIISAINATEILAQKYPNYHFVPVYWMASEDHDFEEINHFYLHGKKICWNSSQTGMTGDFNTESLQKVADLFYREVGVGINATTLKNLFSESYLKHENLASATRFLVNSLFEKYGLIVVDGNHKNLKHEFIPQLKNDLLKHNATQQISQTIAEIAQLNNHYPIQVNPREINVFYLTQGGRNRIIKTQNGYAVHETDLRFSEKELLQILENHPERFSPNVILRPLYQEVILPNLAYIGGGGEIAYWLELKHFFDSENVPFPILMLRNSVLLINEKQKRKLERLGLSIEDLFLTSDDLKTKITTSVSEIPIDFTLQREHLVNQFKGLYEIAEQTDITFLNAVKAQEVKQLKGLNLLEKRLLKAQKRKHHDFLNRAVSLQNELFPSGSLQERHSNFSDFYLTEGDLFIEKLKNNLNPFDYRFSVLG